jgi:hypothetical protein
MIAYFDFFQKSQDEKLVGGSISSLSLSTGHYYSNDLVAVTTFMAILLKMHSSLIFFAYLTIFVRVPSGHSIVMITITVSVMRMKEIIMRKKSLFTRWCLFIGGVWIESPVKGQAVKAQHLFISAWGGDHINDIISNSILC